jgi:hypothetical protein
MANTFTNTGSVILTAAALEAFTAALQPIKSFASDFSAAASAKGTSVRVTFIPSQADASDFGGDYTANSGSSANGVDIPINRWKYVSWPLTDLESSMNQLIRIEMFGRQYGFKLAKAVLQDIWSIVTNANYGPAIFTGASATFDTDSVVDIDTALDALFWPDMDRKLILNNQYYNALIKDPSAKQAQAIGMIGSSAPLQSGHLPNLLGQEVFESMLVPTNGENLVGFAAMPDAMGVAMRYMEPQPGNTYFQAAPVSNEAGMTLGFRDFYDNKSGTRYQVLEANYGFKVINPVALGRLVSA